MIKLYPDLDSERKPLTEYLLEYFNLSTTITREGLVGIDSVDIPAFTIAKLANRYLEYRNLRSRYFACIEQNLIKIEKLKTEAVKKEKRGCSNSATVSRFFIPVRNPATIELYTLTNKCLIAERFIDSHVDKTANSLVL